MKLCGNSTCNKIHKWDTDDADDKVLGTDEHRSCGTLVDLLVWVGRTDIRCFIGSAVLRLGKARSVDVTDVVGIFRYMWFVNCSVMLDHLMSFVVCARSHLMGFRRLMWILMGAGGSELCRASRGAAWVKDALNSTQLR